MNNRMGDKKTHIPLDFIIIGAQKSASTLLHKCLAEHPSVFCPKAEMPCFESPHYEEDGIESLEQRLKNAPQTAITGIKRPDYLALPYCAKRIHSYAPNAKLIITLRNPISRAISAYHHLMLYGFLPVEDINIGLPKIISGEYNKMYPKANEIIEYGYYAKHIACYLKYYDRSQMFILIDDLLYKNKNKSIKSLYKFIGVDDSFKPKSLSKRTNLGIYDFRRLRFLRLRNSVRFQYNSENTDLLVRKNILALTMNSVVVGIDRLILALIFGNSRPILSDELKKQISSKYNDDILQLESLLERDLSKWKII